jgi:hypothetical protein
LIARQTPDFISLHAVHRAYVKYSQRGACGGCQGVAVAAGLAGDPSLKFEFALWTRDMVAKLIMDKFGLNMSRPGSAPCVRSASIVFSAPLTTAVAILSLP